MPTRPIRRPVTAARVKTAQVQKDVRTAESELHEANSILSDSRVGSLVTRESVQAALNQSVNVETQLHDAVAELQVVTDLLKVAEEEKASRDSADGTMAGRRSGEGLDSVMEQMSAVAQRQEESRVGKESKS